MKEELPGSADRRSAIAQSAIALVVLLLFSAAVSVAQISFKYDSILVPHRVEDWKQTDGMFFDSRFFANADERLLYQVLPNADYSRGGVYFTGASALQRSLMLWDLPASEQQQIHNYCIVGASHTRQAQFIKYLIEHENLLKAGGNKTCIITEVSLAASGHGQTPMGQFNETLWRGFFSRYGLFTYDFVAGLGRSTASDAERDIRLIPLRTHIFWSWALRCLQGNRDTYLAGNDRHDAITTRDRWMQRLGPDWEAGMDIELQQYADLLDYLQARQVAVAAVYMPDASWCDGFAPSIRYRDKVTALLAARHIQMLDLAHKLPDSGFADSLHLNYEGSKTIQPELVDLSERCLRQINAAAPHPQ